MIGYAICGSFCTIRESLNSLKELVLRGEDVLPILSENAYTVDTRFFSAKELIKTVTDITGKSPIHTIEDAEPLGAASPLSELIIAPCTGNTIAKIANGITDTSVTMAAKAHLRCDRPLLIALASNDSMSQNLGNIAKILLRRSVYFVPMKQDDPKRKPHSLVADFPSIVSCFQDMRDGVSHRPIFIT